MQRSDSMSPVARVGLVSAGILVAAAGWVAQSLAGETCSLDYVGVYPSDGTAILYDAGQVGEGRFVDSGPGTGFLYARGGEGEPQILFEGTQDEAAVWLVSQGWVPAYRGTAEGAAAWVDEQCAGEDSVAIPYALYAAGPVLILLGIGLGWRRARPA